MTLPGDSGETLWTFSDISELKRIQSHAEHGARHDPLTGLPNRRLLEEHLAQAIGRAARSGQAVSIAFLDLDRFKPINDRHGHEAGDRVLAEVARRLRRSARQGDLVARFGGDEFVVVMEGLADEDQAEKASQHLARSIGDPIEIGHGMVASVGCSYGMAHYPLHGQTAAALLAHADKRLYAAKQAR